MWLASFDGWDYAFLYPLLPTFDYIGLFIVIDNFLRTLFQPPAFPKETPESIKKYIEETYLEPRLDTDEFAPEKVGKQWEFDWFDKAKVPLEPSVPRTVVVPIWEPPFRRPVKEKWKPKFEEV